MVFRIASSPYTHNQRQTSRIMMLVLLAALPGIAVHYQPTAKPSADAKSYSWRRVS